MSQRVPELDGIRGIAIALVVFWHYFVVPNQAAPGTFFSYLQSAGHLTWTGVDLFFVLSGFLIGGILLDSRDSPAFFKTFYIRRFFRIVPLYAVWLVSMCLTLHFAEAGKFSTALNGFMLRDKFSMVPYVAYLQNFWMAANNSLGGYSSEGTWSLAIEEQFYLTLPFIIRFAPRRWLGWILGAGIIAAPILRTLIVLFFPHYRMAAFVLMPCRADSLLLGVLGAILIRNEVWRLVVKRSSDIHIFVTVALLAIVALFRGIAKNNPFDGTMLAAGYSFVALLYTSILLFAVLHTRSWLAWLLRSSWLRWLGGIAYGIYLYHFQAFLLIFALLWQTAPQRIANAGEWAACFAALGGTLLVCRLSWVFFERPLIDIGHRLKY